MKKAGGIDDIHSASAKSPTMAHLITPGEYPSTPPLISNGGSWVIFSEAVDCELSSPNASPNQNLSLPKSKGAPPHKRAPNLLLLPDLSVMPSANSPVNPLFSFRFSNSNFYSPN